MAIDVPKIWIDILLTPIGFIRDPVGHTEDNPLGVLIWLGIAVWVVIKIQKKKKKQSSSERSKS